MKEVVLGDVCTVTTGQSAPQADDAFTEMGTPFIRAGSLAGLLAGKSESEFERITEENANKYKLKLFKKNTIVFPKSGMSAKIGRVYRLKQDCYLVSHLAAITTGKEVDPGYLHRWFEKNSPSRLIANDAYPSIKTSEIQKVIIPLPAKEEQKRIAVILDKADAIRSKRQHSIELIDQLLRSVFLDMFGDPLDSEIYPRLKFSELCTLQQGLQIPISKRKEYPSDNSYKYITVAYLNGKKKEEYIENPRKSVICKDNDILMTRTGNTGQVVTGVSGVFHNNFFRIDFDRTKLDKQYLQMFLQMPKVRQLLLKLASTTTIPDLNHSEFFNISVQVPPIHLQQKFSNFSNNILEVKKTLAKGKMKSEEFFKSLTQQAFNGDLTKQTEAA